MYVGYGIKCKLWGEGVFCSVILIVCFVVVCYCVCICDVVCDLFGFFG